ncbi:Nucleotide-binding universal stress protein, UspA family [Alteribacillus persepolensis]|uniref:Nucleotide-binding universal stress protein, UspA family n=1 Tax=Alteribacillus persepolensis TaxID=568899 RepID=A0A1G8FIJ6_9BACI|nr:universal stress protein [Alteribacillus persepolensis]SDH81886.1 Nucleotide-binding universal stress protein, UspA family [Alteribacillus persepolensis]
MYQKVLLAADGSDHSLRSADHAIALANKGDRPHIDVIYVVDGDKSKTDVLHYGNTNLIHSKRKEKLAPVEEKLKEHNFSYKVHVKHGEPGPTIVKFANDGDYDCLVVGSRGLNQLQTMVLGSVSHKVAKRVQCPVMIVK